MPIPLENNWEKNCSKLQFYYIKSRFDSFLNYIKSHFDSFLNYIKKHLNELFIVLIIFNNLKFHFNYKSKRKFTRKA